MSKHKSRIGLLISIAISAGLLFYLVMGLDWQAFFSEIHKVKLIYLPLLIFLFYLFCYLRTLRWRLLLPSNSTLSNKRLFQAIMMGMLASTVLPLRAGEIVRPWILSRWQPVKFATGFASIVSERAFDVLALLGFLWFSLSELESVPQWVNAGAQGLGILTLSIISLMLLSYFYSNTMLTLAQKAVHKIFGNHRLEFAEKLLEMFGEFLVGLKAIASFKDLILILVLSLLIWLEITLFYQVILWSFGENPSFWVAIVVNVMIAIAVAAPSAPGFIGTFQLGCVLALGTIYGFTREFAMAYSVVAHSSQLLLIIITGLFILASEGLKISDLKQPAPES